MNNVNILFPVSVFFLFIIYFMFNPHKYEKTEYGLAYKHEMFKSQKHYMEKITENIAHTPDKSEINRPTAIYVIYYYDNFSMNDIEIIKNNAKNLGWKDIALPHEENIIHASCNGNMAFNMYQDKQLKIAISWRKHDHDCPNN